MKENYGLILKSKVFLLLLISVIIYYFKEVNKKIFLENLIFGIILAFLSFGVFLIFFKVLLKILGYKKLERIRKAVYSLGFIILFTLEIGIVLSKKPDELIINQFMIVGIFAGKFVK